MEKENIIDGYISRVKNGGFFSKEQKPTVVRMLENIKGWHEKELEETTIGTYLDVEMKGHGLPMGVEYYELLGRSTERAEEYLKEKAKWKN